MKMSNKEVIKKVSSYVGRYKIHLIASILLALLNVGSMLYIPILIGRAIDNIIGAGNVDFKAIGGVLLEMCAFIAICALSQWIMNALNNKITYNVIRDMRAKAFSKIESLPISFIDANQTGDIVSRVISDVDQFADGLLMGFTQFFTGVATIVITLAFMLSINLWIALVVVVVTPISFLIAGFIAKKTHKMFALQSKSDTMAVGARNAEAVVRILGEMKIPILAQDTGDSYGRTVEFFPETGDFVIKAVGRDVKKI